MRKLILFTAALLCAAFPVLSQVVINTNAFGPGSLQAAVALAKATAGPQTITFAIPGAGPFIINSGTIQLNSATPASILLDATTQPGYTAGNPVVILKGGGTGNGFDVSMSNLTIKGFIVQNYTNGYLQSNGNVNSIESCWFGLDATGTAEVRNKEYGILINGGSVAIGSQSDFSAATRNIISGSGISGIKFQTATAASYVGNNFIGTDKTGGIALGNGWDVNAGTEFRHGITINSTSTITIKNNVISGNYSGGIDITGNSGNATIIGNKIGTNFLGTLPLGNKNFGIRIKNSGSHAIGGLGVGNIISANGSSDYPFEQNTTDPLKFDWYNSCGIYLFNSSNNIISGNNIGVDASGNTYTTDPKEMGNFYCGLKIDGTSANNKVGTATAGNVLGQNGFRSSIAAGLAGLCCLDGHGMIIKDATTTATTIVGNHVGVGLDGTSKIGNKQDGISVQGSSGTKIGGTLPGERNIIGDNTWGIFIASNYYNSQTSNCQILGNYIGTDASGNLPIGNGVRSDNTSGGGIGIIHFTQGTLVGGAAAGAGNVISGNRIGISMLGNSPIAPAGNGSTTAKIYGNSIGLGANGTTIVKNEENGIYISEKAFSNDIGGINAGEGNKIVGNGQNGIYSQDATNNRIRGNSIFSNELTGIGFDKTTATTVQRNLIYSNLANGINLAGLSNGNSFFGNTIGDLTAIAKGNTGDGISITGSSNNIIGGVTAGEGNTIANNSANAISMLGASSNNNSIHKNVISCNGARGIELNGAANGNYAAPTFSGTETSLTITGPVNSFIELYQLDGCNNCATNSNKLQGRTLIPLGSGPSPIVGFVGTAGVTYTATASAGNTTAAHKTSEFSDCYSLCSPVTLTLNVTGATICSNATVNPTVGIIGAEANVKYDARLNSANGTLLGTFTPTSNGTISITVNRTLLAQGSNTIYFTALGPGCTIPSTLNNKATIIVNKLPTINLTVSGATICSNATVNPTVGITGAEANVTYEARLGSFNGALLGTATPTSGGNITITVDRTLLLSGTNTLFFAATIQGCGTTNLTNQATIIVNKPPIVTLTVTGALTCSSSLVNPTVGINNAEANVTYEAHLGSATGVLLGNTTPTTPGNITVSVDRTKLSVGDNIIFFTATISGCGTANLTNQATITVDSPPLITSPVTSNSPICFGGQGEVYVTTAEKGKSYQVFDQNNIAVSNLTLAPVDGNLKIILKSLAVNTYTLTVKASVPGCAGTVDLTQKVTFVVNKGLNGALTITYKDTICLGERDTITIVNSQLNVEYQAFNNVGDAALSAKVIGTGGAIKVPLLLLNGGNTEVYFNAVIGGCGTVRLGNTAKIFVNTDVIKTLNATVTTPICLGDIAVVTITGAEKDKYYQVFENKKAVSTKVQGNNTSITLDVPSLTKGDHKFTINVTVPGCKNDTLLQNPITKVNSSPDSTLKVGTNGPVCDGNQAVFYIVKSELGKKYEIFDGTTSVSQKVDGNGDTLKINLKQLAPGTYILTAKATSQGCLSSIDLKDKGTITINSNPIKVLNASVNGPVCLGVSAEVTVEKAENGKFYEVFYNGQSISASTLGRGSDLVIPVNTTIIPAGSHPLSIGVRVPGCLPDTLTEKPILEINDKASDSLKVIAVTSPICVNTDGAVMIFGIQPKVSYQAYIGIDSVSIKLSGPGPNIILPIPASKLSTGLNVITVKAFIKGCSSTDLKDTAGIKVNPIPRVDLGISVDPSVICEGGESFLSVYTSETGVSYQAVIATKIVSDAVLGNGSKIELLLTGLPLGENTISVKASVGGCADKNLDSTVMVIVNKGAKIDYAVAGDTVCKPDGGNVTIGGSETGVAYLAFNKTTNTLISDTIRGTGSAIMIPLFPSNNLVDSIVIKAVVQGCGIVRLDNTGIVVTNDNNRSKLLPTSGSTICVNDGNATATIKGALSGVLYDATVNNNKIPALVGTGSDLVFSIPISNLNEGDNIVTFTAKAKACGAITLDSTALVVVNNNTTSAGLATMGSDICVYDNIGIATIIAAKAGVYYKATIGSTLLPDSLLGIGSDLNFSIDGTYILPGSNPVSFTAYIKGCTPVPLANNAIITRNDNTTSQTLLTVGSTVCGSETSASAVVKGAKKGITYTAYTSANVLLDTQLGNDADLQFSIPVRLLASGDNVIHFIASVKGCRDVLLDNKPIITVLGQSYAISGSTLTCYNSIGFYNIASVPGITSYNWTVPIDAAITSGQGTNAIEVKFGQTSGVVTVTPVGTTGACTGISSDLYIDVQPSYSDTLSILGRDTLCVGARDTISVNAIGVVGVDYIVWTLPNGIQINDTLNKGSVFERFDLSYLQTGIKLITATPHIRCSNSFGVPDSLKVKVYGYPIAEAGNYPLVENDLSTPISLNGTGSSLQGELVTDTLTYTWSTLDRNIFVNNPKSLNGASIIPTESETKIYLTVSNKKGRCPSKDSAIVSVVVNIDIPNVFTPNGDGVHDTWEIKNLHNLYPNCTVEVFNKWGSFVFKNQGYSEPWDGTRNGEDLPVATYYYVIDFKDGKKPHPGSITIIR